MGCSQTKAALPPVASKLEPQQATKVAPEVEPSPPVESVKEPLLADGDETESPDTEAQQDTEPPTPTKDSAWEAGPIEERGSVRDVVAAADEEPPALSFCAEYLGKFRGAGVASPPRPPLTQHGFSFLGAFIGLAVLGLLDLYVVKRYIDPTWTLLAPPFGAMAVLVFSACKAPLAQPRNVVLGNVIGGAVGYLTWTLMEAVGLEAVTADHMWFTAALSVALTIVAQEQLGAVHPPGGASALLYVIVPPMRAMGIFYPLCPCALGAVIFVVLGMFTNNLSAARAYPQTSWTSTPREEAAPATWLEGYVAKFRGAGAAAPSRPPLTQGGFSFVGSFAAISTLGLLPKAMRLVIPSFPEPLLIGGFGAMAVLLFSATKAPLAQPRNAILGNGLGALAGVAVFKAFELFGKADAPELLWLRVALAVPSAIVMQEMAGAVHPPGGATAIIFLIMKPMHLLSFAFVVSPAMFGAAIFVCIALLTNNLSAARAYPQTWW